MIFENARRQEFNKEEIERGARNSEVIWPTLQEKIKPSFQCNSIFESDWGHDWNWEPKPQSKPETILIADELDSIPEDVVKEARKRISKAIIENFKPAPKLIKYDPTWQGAENYDEWGISVLKERLRLGVDWNECTFLYARNQSWHHRLDYRTETAEDIQAQIGAKELILETYCDLRFRTNTIDNFINQCKNYKVCVINKIEEGFKGYRLCSDYQEKYNDRS